MLNTSLTQFKKKHLSKKNQILFYSIKSNGIRETENLINNFLTGTHSVSNFIYNNQHCV